MEFNDKQFEKLFFKGLITDNEVLSSVYEYFEPSIIEDKNMAAVCKFYKKFYKENNKIPTIEELKLYMKDNAFLNQVKASFSAVKDINFGEVDKALFYKNTETFLKERLAMQELNVIVDNLAKKNINAADVVKRFTKVAGITLTHDDGFDIFKDVEKFIADCKKPVRKLSTGFENIDKYISGGLPVEGKVIGVVCAETNMGKSIMLGNLATNCVKDGKKVLLISLEMSEMVYANRLYSALYDFDVNKIGLFTDELRKKVAENNNGGCLIVKEFPPGSMTVPQIRSYIEKLVKKGHKFDLICIDYLTLLRAPGADNSNDAGEEITRGLRALSYEFEVPFFTAAQLNREGFNNKPDMSNMARSIAICAEADLIVGLYREEGDDELSVMRLSFLKNRLGAKGFSTKLYFNTECLRFEDLEENEEELSSEQEAMMNTFDFFDKSNK